MVRCGYEGYERDMLDRSGRDPREMQQEQYPRERVDRENRPTLSPDTDRFDYTRDGRPDRRSDPDSASRLAYPYAEQNRRYDRLSRGYMDDLREGRYDLTSRGCMDDLQDRRRDLTDPRAERKDTTPSRYQDYFLVGEGINREVIQYDICRYLGNDATARPYNHPDGRTGYLIKAYQAPSSAMMATLKLDSQRFENEQAQKRRRFGQFGIHYANSAVVNDRQREGEADVPQARYSRYEMDSGINCDRGTDQSYRNKEPTMDARQDPTMDTWLDRRQQLPLTRHDSTPPVSQVYPEAPIRAASYQASRAGSLNIQAGGYALGVAGMYSVSITKAETAATPSDTPSSKPAPGDAASGAPPK